MDSPDSPLSDIHSDDFGELPSARGTPEVEVEELSNRPNKRQRTSGASKNANRRSNAATSTTAAFDAHEDDHLHLNLPSDADISSDTDGSVPGSPHLGPTDDDEDISKEQVTVCKWLDCMEGDLGNMDLLVRHIHEVHIHARAKRYSCEWTDCTRRGISHASGYALRAHMRSHTKEKPFFCLLSECDRSFTRSDALAKHMRTVHETEALRPSDPVPKHHSSNPQNKTQRLRLTFNKLSTGATKTDDDSPISNKARDGPPSPGASTVTATELEYANNNPSFTRNPLTGDWVARFPSDMHFTDREIALAPAQLMVLLSRQVRWATEAGEKLKQENANLEKRRKAEWVAKEIILQDYTASEQAKAIAEVAQEEADTAEMELDEEDGTILESREVGNEDDGIGQIPPYPYAAPDMEQHQHQVPITGLV